MIVLSLSQTLYNTEFDETSASKNSYIQHMYRLNNFAI